MARDGGLDIIAIGNMYVQETLYGRYGASLGTILAGDGNLHWTELPPNESGFVVYGDARFIESLRTREGSVYAITKNNDSIQFFARAVTAGLQAYRKQDPGVP